MIVQKDFLNKLKDFGLNTYESKLWTALLSRGISTAGELSDIANVPRSRSYDVLESLEKKGFIIMKLGKPIKYIAVPPLEVLERVKKKIQEKTDNELTQINKLLVGPLIKELNSLHTQGFELIEPNDLSGSIKGRSNLYNHFETMIKKATKAINIVTSTSGLKRKTEAFKDVLAKAAQRGVKIKIAAPLTKETIEAEKELSKYAEVRNTDIKSRFCLVDGTELTFMLMDDAEVHHSYDVGIWVNTPYFTKALADLFDVQWEKSK